MLSLARFQVLLILFGLSLPLSLPASAATRLGLHVTQEELYCWRQRAALDSQGANGITCPVKYKVAGDVSTNSPGDWADILTRGGQFAASPLRDNWQGQTAAGSWQPNGHSCTYTEGMGVVVGCVPNFDQGIWILAAGFATLVDPAGHNYASQIRTALLTQIAYAGTAFLNTAKWPNSQIGDGYSYAITTWLSHLAFAYDYIRIISPGTFSAGEKTSIEAWFSDAAFYWGRNVNYLIVNNAFPNRNTQFDTSVSTGGKYPTDIILAGGPDPGNGGFILYYDCANSLRGPLGGNAHSLWNDRSSSQVLFSAIGALLNGTLTNDAQTQRWAKMWFKEWLTYATFANNMTFDYKEWSPDLASQGWTYATLTSQSMAEVADLFARLGDDSLYTWSTSSGWIFSNNPSGFNGNTDGGTKSVLNVLLKHATFVTQFATSSPNWVGSDDIHGGPHCGNANYLISPVAPYINPPGPYPLVHDIGYAPYNLYFQNTTLKTTYTRTIANAPAYPASPVTNSNAWGGVWSIFPGVLFMFGQLDGVVNPYSLGTTLTPPRNVRIVVP